MYARSISHHQSEKRERFWTSTIPATAVFVTVYSIDPLINPRLCRGDNILYIYTLFILLNYAVHRTLLAAEGNFCLDFFFRPVPCRNVGF